ncbi:MAG TPA: flagellar type III secretion system protein FliR, partial [Sulfurospirillum arcachonense]|nr:flagellar type III secretion system protein FliR [Sulfurospirillum arcachonense]
MGWTEIFNETNVVGFLLLFFRFAGLFIAVPIFNHQNIPMNI